MFNLYRIVSVLVLVSLVAFVGCEKDEEESEGGRAVDCLSGCEAGAEGGGQAGSEAGAESSLDQGVAGESAGGSQAGAEAGSEGGSQAGSVAGEEAPVAGDLVDPVSGTEAGSEDCAPELETEEGCVEPQPAGGSADEPSTPSDMGA